MTRTAPLLLVSAFVLGVIAGGLQHWLLDYRHAEPPISVVGPGLGAIGLLTALLVAARAAKPKTALMVMAACLPVAIMARVMMEAAQDPTSHNLWPFEVVIGLIVGLVPAGIGVAIGIMLRRILDARG